MVNLSAANASAPPKTLRTQLQEAYDTTGRDYKRNAMPIVFEEYKLFMTSGRYPYTAEVVKDIALKYGLISDANQRVDHQAVHDANDGALIQLHTEVYIASTQYGVLKMQARERELAEQGFLPITQLEPVAGMKIELPDGVTYRLKRAGRDWALLAPGKRTRGISLNGLVEQQRAYEGAVELGRTSMDNPVVRGFKLAAGPTLGQHASNGSLGNQPQTAVEVPTAAHSPVDVPAKSSATSLEADTPMLDFGDLGR